MTRALPTVLLVAAWSLCTTPAAAQGAEEQARNAFAAAQAAEQKGDPRAACEHYRSSLASFRAPGTLERVARCDALDGHYVAAVTTIVEAIGMLTPDNVEDQAAYEALRATWKSKLAKLDVRVAPGASVASLAIDGAPVSSSDRGLELDPGDHVIVADGRSKTVTLRSGENPPLELPLPLSPPAVTPAPRRAEPGPRSGADRSGMTGLQTAAVVSFGVGGLALAGAAVTGVMALDRDATAESTCASRQGPGCRDAVDDANALLGPNLAMWIVGAVGASAGVTFLLLDAQGPEETAALRVHVGPAAVRLAAAF